jgi:hypothetical protein
MPEAFLMLSQCVKKRERHKQKTKQDKQTHDKMWIFQYTNISTMFLYPLVFK